MVPSAFRFAGRHIYRQYIVSFFIFHGLLMYLCYSSVLLLLYFDFNKCAPVKLMHRQGLFSGLCLSHNWHLYKM